MEKIIIVFDDLLFIRMFVHLKDGVISAEYLSKNKDEEDDRKRIAVIREKLAKGKLELIGYLPAEENKKSVLYTRKTEMDDPEILIAIKQNLENKGIFAKIIPSNLKDAFLKLEKLNILYVEKKSAYSAILSSDDKTMNLIGNIIKEQKGYFSQKNKNSFKKLKTKNETRKNF